VTVGWTLVSALPLLAIAVGILSRPDFPLGLGFIRTRGLAGLWCSLLPAVVGIAGVVLLRSWPRVGAGLILGYAAFWCVVLAGLLPVVWNTESSFCLRGLGLCITAAWLGAAVILGLLALFMLVVVWSWRSLKAGERPRVPSPPA